jgi:cytochrome P450
MLPALKRDPTGVFLDAARRFGQIVHFKIGPRHGYLVTNPADIRHVLQDNARNYHKGPLYEKLRASLGNGLVTSEDAYWLRQRRIAQPAFHRERIAAMAASMVKAAADTDRRWQTIAATHAPIDVAEEMMHLTQTIIIRTMLGGSIDLNGVAAAWSLVNRHIGESFWSLGLTDSWPTPRNRRFKRALAVLDDAVLTMIRQRGQQTDGRDDDVLSMLLNGRDEETGESMTERQVRDEVMTIFLAGHETTALALAWTWFLLSAHPDARRRLESELDETLGGREPTYADLDRLPFNRMVIEEAIRLYPPVWGFSRRALGSDQIGAYALPAGWLVLIVPYVLHRHPEYWEQPDRFDPERFSASQSAIRPKHVYLPFGAGPRHCIGNHFAMTEAQLVMATLAAKFRLRLADSRPIRPQPLITLRPGGGIKMVIERR